MLKKAKAIVAALMFVMLFLGGPVQAGLNDGLFAYYPFNGNANDESGNGNHGTVNGGQFESDKTGNPNAAYGFNGSGQENIVLPIMTPTDGTISFLVFFNSLATYSTPYPNYIFNSGLSNWNIMRIGVDYTGYPYFGFWESSGQYASDPNFRVYEGKWYLFTATWGSSGMKFYVDGSMKGTNSNTGNGSGNQQMYIGCKTIQANVFDGYIDELRIYNRPLSASEVQQIYSGVSTTTFDGVLTSDVNSGLVPLTVTFYAVVAQGSEPFTYDYDFGDNSTKSGGSKTESHTYQAAGTYTAQVTVTDSNGTTYVLQKNIVVTDKTTVDTYQDNLQSNADQVKTAADGKETTDLLKNSENVVNDTLKAISNADSATKTQVEASVKTKVENLVKNTATNLDTLIQSGDVADEDYKEITGGLGGVVSNMVKNKVPITDDTLTSAKSISEKVYLQTVETILANENLTQAEIDQAKTDKTKAQEMFTSKPHLLDEVLDTSGIKINTQTDFSVGDVNTVAKDHGLTQIQTGQLYNAIKPNLNVQLKVTDNTQLGNKTIAEFAAEIYDTYYGKTLKTYTVEDITGNLLLEFTDGTYVSFLITNVYIKQDFIPLVFFDLPNGNKLGVTDTYAFEFTSYPVFPHSFASEVIKLGIDPVIEQDGSLRIQLDKSASLSLKPGWDYFKSNTFDSMTTSFSVHGGSNPAAEAYALLATYDTGFSQLLPPSIMAMQALTDLLDAIMPDDYRIDSDTGVLTLGSLKLKPDYVFTSSTEIDYTAITAAGGFTHNNQAFEFNDENNDGMPDIIFHSDNPMGHQVLYVVNE